MPTTTRKRTRPGDLIEAVKAGDEETARRIIDEGGFPLYERDDDGLTALFWAIKNGRESIASLLTEKGGVALCEARTNVGDTALMEAADCGRESIARQFLEVGGPGELIFGSVDAWNILGCTALMIAADNGHESVVRLLLEKGANVNAQDREGHTALTVAAERGYESIARLLIEKGSNVNMHIDGRSPLVCAALSGHVPTIRLVLEKRNESDPDTKEENAALMAAATSGCEEAFHAILTGSRVIGIHRDDRKNISAAVQTLMKKVKEKQNTPVRDHARSVQKVIDEDKEQLPDGMYVKLCGINKRAYDEI